MTAAIEVKIDGLNNLLVRFQRVVTMAPQRYDEITAANAHKLVGFIQQHIRAQGLIETGAYLNSWSVLKVGTASYTVTTDADQSDRLEFGFTGVDALGRSYRQPPRPHRRPAAEQSRAAYREDLGKVVPFLWGR